ncbi:MAG: GNAT family N-acetyltransferase, partial [Bdellovibrionales bacterium]
MDLSHPYLISDAKIGDAEELSTLVNSAYRGDSSRLGWTTEADIVGGQRTDPSLLRRTIDAENCKIQCLRETKDGPILGCVFLERTVNGPEVGTYLGMLTVKPNLQ